jgi:hypothetical protein
MSPRLFPSDPHGVGNDEEDSFSEMSGTKRGSGKYIPPTIKPARDQS